MALTRKKLVLLIDDEEAFLEIASARLEAAGFTTEKARGAKEGVAKTHELMPDVVVSDVMMEPGPCGWEVVFAVRENHRTRHIPVVLLTSLDDPWRELKDERDLARARAAEVTVLSKVSDMEKLAERIKKIIGIS